MHSFTIRLKSEEGNLTVIAFVLLVILTLVGVFATKTAQMMTIASVIVPPTVIISCIIVDIEAGLCIAVRNGGVSMISPFAI